MTTRAPRNFVTGWSSLFEVSGQELEQPEASSSAEGVNSFVGEVNSSAEAANSSAAVLAFHS